MGILKDWLKIMSSTDDLQLPMSYYMCLASAYIQGNLYVDVFNINSKEISGIEEVC